MIIVTDTEIINFDNLESVYLAHEYTQTLSNGKEHKTFDMQFSLGSNRSSITFPDAKSRQAAFAEIIDAFICGNYLVDLRGKGKS